MVILNTDYIRVKLIVIVFSLLIIAVLVSKPAFEEFRTPEKARENPLKLKSEVELLDIDMQPRGKGVTLFAVRPKRGICRRRLDGTLSVRSEERRQLEPELAFWSKFAGA